MEKYFSDITVIGGGASGMLCAATAAEKNKNKKVILIEKEEKTGRKLLATGNGRCNLSNLNARAASYNGSFPEGLELLFQQYPAKEVINRFESLGLLCCAESDGRVYPVSKRSSSVADVLNSALKRFGVQVLCGFPVKGIKKEKHRFTISGEHFLIISEKVVICTGGITYPKLGSDGNIFPLLKSLGHKIVPLFPALCPLECSDISLKVLKGVRCHGKVSLIDKNTVICAEIGEIQFTERTISGVCVFNLARAAKKIADPVLSISLLPDYSEKEIYSLLLHRREIFSEFPANEIFMGIFHKNIGYALVKRIGIDKNCCYEFTDEDLISLSKLVNNWRFSVRSGNDVGNSQITAGGVSGTDINPVTFESKRVKNLYFCGETIDVDGNCGGYNLQFAFASALKVGDLI